MHGGKNTGFQAEPEKGRSPESAENESFCAEAELSADGPVVDSSKLFGGHKQVVIGHNGQRYVLKITRYGKLILNK
jgi:hemin uptake protein HemP